MSELTLLAGKDKNIFPAVKTKYYPGNKNIAGYIQKIVNNIPECDKFVELFAGSGSVSNFLFKSVGSRVEFHMNDISSEVTDQFDYPSGSTVTNLSYSDLIQSLLSVSPGIRTFLFCDPPYLYSTRPGSTEIYDHEFSDYDHIEFLHIARNIDNNCMITHPACDLYDRTLYGWRTVDVTVRYHNKTSKERLYMNYDKPDRLITYDHSGSDCWDRQRIKRKIYRNLQKISSLPAAEQEPLLKAIAEKFFTIAVRKDVNDCTGSETNKI